MAEAKQISYHAQEDAPTDERLSLSAGAPVLRQHQGSVLGNGDGVLEVGGEGAVGRVDGPSVPFAEADAVIAERDHRLYGEGHPREQARTRSRAAVVRDLGILMHLAPDPVGNEVPYDPVTARLGEGLYGVAHIAKLFAGSHLIRRRGETLSRGRKQPEDVLGHVSHGDGS